MQISSSKTMQQELVDSAVTSDGVITLQSLREFVAVTRKGKMPSDEAAEQIKDWMILFPVIKELFRNDGFVSNMRY